MLPIDLPTEKKVGHLTLLRQPRTLTPQEFNNLTFAERLELVRLAQGRQKYDLLIEAADAAELVPRLPAQELYLMVRELGPEDVPEIFPLLTTEQFTVFLDLDCWDKESLGTEPVLRWLALLLESGEEQVLRIARELDFDLLVLLLKKLVQVVRGPEDGEDDDIRAEALRRDGGYQIEYRDPKWARLVGGGLDILFRHDHDFYRMVLEAVRWELEDILEEEVLSQRLGRLLDRGFPTLQEAMGLYAWLDPAGFQPGAERKFPLSSGEEGVAAPAFALTLGRPGELLAPVLAAGVNDAIAWELACLVNKQLIADQVDIGDPARVREAAADVYRYLNLALAHLGAAAPNQTALLLETCYLEHLYRVGFSLTLQLQRRARTLSRSSVAPYLDGPYRALVEALQRRKPQFFEGIAAPDRGGERPFASPAELEQAAAWLEQVEAQRALFEGPLPFAPPLPEAFDLNGCLPDTAADVTLSDLFLTALANRLLGRDFAPEAIPRGELVRLHGLVCREGRVDDRLRRETLAWLEGLAPHSSAFGQWCFDAWDEGFCGLQIADLDPRYLGGLIVRL